MEPEKAIQPELFQPKNEVDRRRLVLHALGDFQTRGFELVGREIAIDRLLGAFRRACLRFDCLPLSDKELAESLRNLGAVVTELPGFVAKHPFRVEIDEKLAKEALAVFESCEESE